MQKAYLEIDFTTTIHNGVEKATAIVREGADLNLAKGKVIAYSVKGQSGLLGCTRQFFRKYFPNHEVRYNVFIDNKLKHFTGELHYGGADLWGYDLELKKNQSAYD